MTTQWNRRHFFRGPGALTALQNGTPLCNVWLTMLNGIGVESERHGDIAGAVKELQA